MIVVKPLVSVIIPLYNAADYIDVCIQSVLAQTWSAIEVIVVDDESTDNSYDVAKKIENEHVRIIRQKNAGASAARNRGLLEARGKYIQFLDADDFLSHDKIASQVVQLEAKKDYLAICGTVYFNDNEPPLKKKVQMDWFSEGSDNPIDFLIKLYGGNGKGFGGMIQTNTWLTPRTLIDKAGVWNSMRSPDDDGEFFCRMILASKGILYSAGINYYRKFDNRESLSNRNSYQNSYGVLHSWLLKAEYLKPYEDVPGLKKALARNFTELCYQNYPAYPKLCESALSMAKHYGGLTHEPWFGNNLFNRFRKLLPWKVSMRLQYYYQLANKKRNNGGK